MTLSLQTGFAPADQATAELAQSFVSKVDARKKGGKNSEALTDVVCSMLALRGHEFSVNKKLLRPEMKDAATCICDIAVGSLLKRAKGKNRYTINTETAPTLVVDASEPVLAIRVGNQWVQSYASPQRIQSADLVTTINSYRAVKLEWQSVGQGMQYVLGDVELPLKWSKLEMPAYGLVDTTTEAVQSLRERLQHQMSMHRWNAVLVGDKDTETFSFAVTELLADRFSDGAMTILMPWFQERGLPLLRFPTTIHPFGTEHTIHHPGINVDLNLRSLAGMVMT